MPTSTPTRCAASRTALRARDLRGRVAVREVEADDVDAGAEQCVEHARRIGGGAEGGEDLGAALWSSSNAIPWKPRR